jgi:cob(I)alamin adenosyltransferase
MGSIATKTGDTGETSLGGGTRVSKASLRVEAYGSVDELGASLGFARSICETPEMASIVHRVQVELFTIGAVLATAPESRKPTEPLDGQLVDRLTDDVHGIEATGIVGDWAVPGGHTAAAAFDVARTVCRRAERAVVRLAEAGEPVDALVVPYLNRLSDLLWLIGRKLEKDAGVTSSLREETGREGSRWSRAW